GPGPPQGAGLRQEPALEGHPPELTPLPGTCPSGIISAIVRSGPRVPFPRRALPLLLLLCVAVAALVGAPARVAAAADDDRDPAVVLAERYAPVLAVKPHPEVCGGGEPYAPAAVESVLGHPDVTLVGPDGERIAAPTASDLHGRG